VALPRCITDHLSTHHGIASRSRLVELGLTPTRIDRLLRNGTLERVYRSVYRLTGAPPTPLQPLAAACAFDDRVIAAFTTAGRVWAWRKMGEGDVCVLVPGVSSPLLHGVTIHRCHRIDRNHWIERDDGIRVTTPARTIFDLARVLSDHALESVIEQALERGMTSIPQLYAMGRTLRPYGREGSARFARVLDARPAWLAPVGSDLELRVERALLARGMPQPVRQACLRLSDGALVRPDFYWPDLALVVEVDHVMWHGPRLSSQRDKWRDRQLHRSFGIHTTRVTDEDVQDRFRATIDELVDELTTRLKGTGAAVSARESSQNGEST
jgi:hypothetical protein